VCLDDDLTSHSGLANNLMTYIENGTFDNLASLEISIRASNFLPFDSSKELSTAVSSGSISGLLNNVCFFHSSNDTFARHLRLHSSWSFILCHLPLHSFASSVPRYSFFQWQSCTLFFLFIFIITSIASHHFSHHFTPFSHFLRSLSFNQITSLPDDVFAQLSVCRLCLSFWLGPL
jgi:hypothetical protein